MHGSADPHTQRKLFIEKSQAVDASLLRQAPNLKTYIARIGAEARNFRRYEVEDHDRPPVYGAQRAIKARIAIVGHTLKCNNDEFAPTDAEADKIAEELKKADWPTWADNILPSQVETLKRELGGDPARFCVFPAPNGNEYLFVQERIYPNPHNPLDKNDLPWTMWTDGHWRNMAPDGSLPLYNLPALNQAARVMVHEGAMTARRVSELIKSSQPYPWLDELARSQHLGWPGGAKYPHGVDWKPLKRLPHDVEIIIACDNDQIGKEALTTISQILQRPLKAVVFDKHFYKGFDLADIPEEFPKVEDWWKENRYIGPRLETFIRPATWATEAVPPPGSKGGRPTYTVREEFAAEWVHVSEPPVFINRYQPNRMLAKDTFNHKVRAFSHVDDTARLLAHYFSSNVDSVTYAPGRPTGENYDPESDGQLVFNTFLAPRIRPLAGGDKTPWLKFLKHLFPIATDRHEAKRWIATLIMKLSTRMHYGMLLISSMQGTGKGTLGYILMQMVGSWNTSVPSEHAITRSDFNSWIAHKRLAVVHEIYSGENKATYNRLKSLVTDPRLLVNRKNIEEYHLDIWVHIFACSNSLKALYLDDEDRRWLVPKVTEAVRPDEYWQGLYAWLRADGLRIIRQWAEDFLKTNKAVAIGERAPMTSLKQEVIEASRSAGKQLAFDFADYAREYLAAVQEKDQKAGIKDAPPCLIFSVHEIHEWVAKMRGLDPAKDQRVMESPLTIRKALLTAGLHEPAPDPDKTDPRIKVNGRRSHLVATHPPGVVTSLSKEDPRYRHPNEIAEVPMHIPPKSAANGPPKSGANGAGSTAQGSDEEKL